MSRVQYLSGLASDAWVYEFGAERGFFQAVSVDQRSWLALPWPGHVGKTIRDIFTGALG